MIVQDSRQHFTLHAVVDNDEDMAALFEAIVGTPVKYEMVHCAKWVQRLLLAEHYLEGRVFIAGDAAHLVIPTGGLGMNTGVGDAIDMSWKLAATLRGWGGPTTAAVLRGRAAPGRRHQCQGLRRRHRRPDEMARRVSSGHRGRYARGPGGVGASADDCAGGGAEIIPRHRRRAWLSLCRLSGDLRRAWRARAEHRGVCADELARGAAAARLARAGRVSVHDRIGDGFTLLRLGREQGGCLGLAEAFARSVRLSPCSISIAKRRVASMASIIFWSGRICTWCGAAMRCRRTRTVARVVTGH